jgi:hypothetical protein
MKTRAARLAELLTPTRAQLHALSRRVERLEAEVQETRRFGRRLAELADIVEEVLVPAANRDDERIRKLLDEYSERL